MQRPHLPDVRAGSEDRMDVRPTPSGFTPRPPTTSRARGATPASPNRPVGTPPAAGDEMGLDRVELSPAALELSARLDDAVPVAPELSADRTRQVAERMT